MPHKFNCDTDRKEPKKHASERTLSRFRLSHELQTSEDVERVSILESIKSKIQLKKDKMNFESIHVMQNMMRNMLGIK